jgi:hypothetical protein
MNSSHRRVDLLDRDRRNVRADRGVVDQNIEPAELPLGFGDHGTDRFFIAHISKDGVRASTFGCDLGGDWSAIL